MTQTIDAQLLERVKNIDSITEWSKVLADHISWGNHKIADTTAIFNMNSAHSCPNRETQENGESETGLCQVRFNQCYAAKAEKMYDNTLAYRNRQEDLWDMLDADTFAKAFLEVCNRKVRYGNIDNLSDIDLRLSEAGDFRSNGDIYKADRIAQLLAENGINTYTYSASYKLTGWNDVTELTVMESVSKAKYGDKQYQAVETTDDIPSDGIHCPNDLQRHESVKAENRIKCGDCRSCITKEGPDVYIVLH